MQNVLDMAVLGANAWARSLLTYSLTYLYLVSQTKCGECQNSEMTKENKMRDINREKTICPATFLMWPFPAEIEHELK